MVCGTFFFLEVIASDFLDKISNIKTLVKSISQGGARPPLLSTRLYRVSREDCQIFGEMKEYVILSRKSSIHI